MATKIKLLKLPIINERFLTSVIKVLSSNGNITKRFLNNIDYLFKLIDLDYYNQDIVVSALIKGIQICVKHRQTTADVKTEDLISEIQMVIPEMYKKQKNDIIIPTIKMAQNIKNPSELVFINSIIDTYLKYSTILLTKDKMSSILTEISSGSMESLDKSIAKYRNTIEQISDEFRKTDSVNSDNIINSIEDNFVDVLMETYDEVKNPKYALRTGLKTLNSMLSEEGGFKSGCYYIFYASINSFKSGILQYCEKWIRKYNSDNYLKMFEETGLIPTIVFYSFENTRTENMQREFFMETGMQLKEIESKDQAVKMFEAAYNSTGSIINVAYIYAEAGTVRVSDMRRQIHTLNDSGYKVIALIADYLELIRPEDEDMHLENRLKLGYISNAFHVMTVAEDIVGITAQQMNRAAEATMTELRNKGQTNIIEQVGGMQFIGESYAIEKPADMSMYIGVERSIFDNKLYLTIKRGKCRYRQTPTRYFVNELKNGFYIEDDLLTDKILSKAAIMPVADNEVVEIHETSKDIGSIRETKKVETETVKTELYDEFPDEYYKEWSKFIMPYDDEVAEFAILKEAA